MRAKNARNALVVILVIALVVMAGVVGACGDSDAEAKATLSAALDKVEAAVAKFQQMGANSTVADIKAARDELSPVWAEVVTAAKDVKDADSAAAEKAWTDIDAAVTAIPDDATIMDAATGIMAPLQALLQVETDLRALVTEDK